MYPTTANTIFFFIINALILVYAYWLNKRFYKSFVYISLPFLFSFFMFLFHMCVHSYIFFSNNIENYYRYNVDATYIMQAVIVSTLFNLFFNIGCSINLFLKKERHLFFNKYIRKYNSKELLKFGIILLIIGILSKILYFIILGGNIFNYIIHYFEIGLEDAGQGGNFTNYLSFFWVCIDLGTDLLLINTLKNHKNKIITVSAILIGLFFSFNSRTSVIKLLLQYLTIIVIYNKQIRVKLALYACSILLPIVMLFLVGLGVYREYTNNNIIINNFDPVYFVVGAIHPMRTISDAIEYKSTFGELKFGKNIILPIIQKPIPRKIWKDKTLNAGAIYTKTMSPGALEAGYTVAPGIGFDLLINFGYIGALCCFLIFGFLLFKFQSILYNSLFYNSDNIIIIIIMAISVAMMFHIRGSDVAGLVIFTLYYIPALFIIFTNIKIKWRK